MATKSLSCRRSAEADLTSKIDIAIMEDRFDPEATHLAFRKTMDGAGAVVAFTGLVRDEADGATVTALRLQHYPGFTEHEIETIAKSASARWPLDGLCIRHRVGELPPTEPIVFVAAAAAHRRAAFEAADFLMDYLKSAAPFWKQEVRNGETCWIEPRAEDYKDRARWGVEEQGERA